MRRGKTELVLGPMFTGKTTEVINRRKKYALAGKSGIVVGYGGDVRYCGRDALCSSHDGLTVNAQKTFDLKDVVVPSGTSVICIDEGQFFANLRDHCVRWNEMGIDVFVAALNAKSPDSKDASWPEVTNLIPYVCNITFLTAVCVVCKSDDASRSFKITNTKADANGVLIGADDHYAPLCFHCSDTHLKTGIPSHYLATRKQILETCKPGGFTGFK